MEKQMETTLIGAPDSKSPPLSVIGLGMPRTGTTTLKTALTMLGLGEGYHYSCMIAKHLDHVPLWTAAALAPEKANFDYIFRGYGHACDSPVNYFYEEYVHRFPEVKFILTQRDPEEWWVLWLWKNCGVFPGVGKIQ